MDKRDERFRIEGDPEDTLRALMDTPPRFVVRLAEQEGTQTYDGQAPAANEPTPAFRVREWVGEAVDRDAAVKAALADWEAEYGDRPRRFDVHVSPA